MKLSSTRSRLRLMAVFAVISLSAILMSSSHREAPLIANDPLADNTDLYAFRSPENPNKIVIIANYIPGQLPQAGPNYYFFGEDVRYEIHIDNNINTTGDDIIYRFTFNRVHEDPSTFFRIRLGKENNKNTYTLQRSMNGGQSFETVISNGVVPPYNVGPRSISSPVGLNAPNYETLMKNAITNASSGERVFAGTVDDPFFVDLGGIFDLGDAPRTTGSRSEDGLKCKNVSTLALEIDISTLQKDKKTAAQAANILDPNYVIGVWASASRQKVKTLNDDGTQSGSGEWVQVSRLGMPLTNEAVIPVGQKDLWNRLTPYQENNRFAERFYNPELALYMDEAFFASAVPAFRPLRIQKNSLGMFGFGNTQNGLFPLKGNAALAGTALAEDAFGSLLLPGPGKPRSVDLWPIFHTGVPNLMPYQLATGKRGNPLAAGKPFIHNFLPNGGDMLRLNMAVPPTPRNSPDFNSLGLVQAAVLGLVDPRFNTTTDLQFIPNMDGFPNGRRLEDDVTRIELQAVSGIVLAAIGLWYDDFVPARRLRFIMEFNDPGRPAGLGFTFIPGPFQGHAYYISTESYTWQEASALAKSRGGYLVTINSQAENDYIFREIRNIGIPVNDFSRAFWIGLNDRMTEGTFMWDNGEPVTYTNWDAGQPDNMGDADFVAIVPNNGKWHDLSSGGNPVTQQLLNVLTYNTGINRNDVAFKTTFPFEQTPWPGTHNCDCDNTNQTSAPTKANSTAAPEAESMRSVPGRLGLAAPTSFVSNTPNPIGATNTLRYNLTVPSQIQIALVDASGKVVKMLVNQQQAAGMHTMRWNANGLAKGTYYIATSINGEMKQTIKVVKNQ